MNSSGSWIDSVASTRTLVFVRTVATGTWRTAFLVMLGFGVWGLLGRGGPLESRLSQDMVSALEAHRMWLGPGVLLPALLSAAATWRRMRRSPLLPGRSTLVTVVILGIVSLVILAPLQARRHQRDDEMLTRQVLLPLSRDLLLSGGSVPSAAPGWRGTPRVRAVVDDRWLAVVDLPWVPGGGLGIDLDGVVSPLGRPSRETRPR